VRRLICHLIDANKDTAFFRLVASYHNSEHFPVMIGSIAPAGSLQQAIRSMSTPTFMLDVTARRQYPVAIARLVRLLKRKQASILHTHCFDPTFIGLIAARLARVRFVFTRHHSDHNIRLGKRWHTRIDAWCARHADHVIAVSEATRRVMTGVEGVPVSQISVVHHGMESLRQPDVQRVSSLRNQLGLCQKHVCLMLARLHEEKGHRFLFDAVPEIVARAGSTIFLLAGEGTYRAALEADVKVRGLEKIVRFLGWCDDVPGLISVASVVVLPSLAESFGFAALEAMSLGKPVVASTAGGIPEVVVDGGTGLLVPPGDSQALANAICRVLQDPDWARMLSIAGRQHAALFTPERMMRGYETVYERLNGSRFR